MTGYDIAFNGTVKASLSHIKPKVVARNIGWAPSLPEARKMAKERIEWNHDIEHAIITTTSGKIVGKVMRGWVYNKNREQLDIIIWKIPSGQYSRVMADGTVRRL